MPTVAIIFKKLTKEPNDDSKYDPAIVEPTVDPNFEPTTSIPTVVPKSGQQLPHQLLRHTLSQQVLFHLSFQFPKHQLQHQILMKNLI